jgi:hypothetical protein
MDSVLLILLLALVAGSLVYGVLTVIAAVRYLGKVGSNRPIAWQFAMTSKWDQGPPAAASEQPRPGYNA